MCLTQWRSEAVCIALVTGALKSLSQGTRRTRRSPRANLEVVKLRDKDKRSSYRLRMNIAGTWLALNPENTSTCMADFQTL